MKKELVAIQQNNPLTEIVKRLPGVSANTRETYFHALNSYLAFLQNNSIEIGLESLEKWVKSFDNPATQNTYLQSIKKILREFYKDDPRFTELEKGLNNIKPVKEEKAIKEADFLTIKEVEKLIKKTSPKLSLFIESFFWTGCRVSELIHIKLKHCRKEKKVINIDIIGKGSKARTVYISVDLFNRIKHIFQGSVYLFEHHGRAYNRVYISRLITKAGEKILDRKISAHTLRHSKVMYLKDVRGLSPDQIQKAVGHSNVSTTLSYYYHGTPSAKDQGII
jgi:integrase